jgi:hypothetical protein
MLSLLQGQRQETLTRLPSATGTGTGAARAGAGASASAAASTAALTSGGGCRLGRGIGHIGDAARKFLHIANDLLRERLHAANDRSSELRTGQG